MVWASILDKLVPNMGRLHGTSNAELSLCELDAVNDALQEAVKDLDAAYHQRTEEEEQT
jgi:hypothetical protein